MRALTVISAMLLVGTLSAQQIRQYTHYVFNHFSINPAVAGSKECLDARIGYRRQWMGFEGAPTTGWASLHARLKDKSRPYVENFHGLGLFVESDATGPLGSTLFYLAYAYHIQMNENYRMSLGTFAGVKQMKLDIGDVTLANADDDAITGSASVLVYPEIAPGVWIYSNRMWAGLSIFQALGNRVRNFGTDTRLTRHYLLSAGYAFKTSRTTTFTPSTLMKIAPGAPLALDINAMYEYKRRLGLGVSYRNQDAFAALIKFSFLKYFTVAYSYDITTSKIRVASSNTHEIILGISACQRGDPGKRAVFCPAFE